MQSIPRIAVKPGNLFWPWCGSRRPCHAAKAEHGLNTRLEGGGGSGDSSGGNILAGDVNRTKNSTTTRVLEDAEVMTFGLTGGLEATARYGRLAASASSFSTYDVTSIPYLWSDFMGVSMVGFEDDLVVRLNGPEQPFWVEMRTTWKLEGSLALVVPDPGTDSGTLWRGSMDFYCDIWPGNTLHGALRRGTYDAHPVSSGEPPSRIIVKQAGAFSFLEGDPVFKLGATLKAQAAALYDSASSLGLPLSTGVIRGSSTVSLKLLSVEIIDSGSGELLSARVSASSGHVYPVARPPKGEANGGITAFSVNRETMDVFLSFASEEGAGYLVQGSDNLVSWDDLEIDRIEACEHRESG